MYLHPDRVDRARTDRWLVANGVTDYVALEPVIIKGNIAEYTAICKRNPKAVARLVVDRGGFCLRGLRRKRVRIRIPYRNVA